MQSAKTQRVGARFPAGRHLERHSEPGEPDAEYGPSTGARLPPAEALERHGIPRARTEEDSGDPPTEPVPAQPAAPPEPARPVAPDYADEHDEDAVEPGTRVRPYVLTKGRTRYAHNLAIETLVSLEPGARWEGAALHTEYQPVRALCTVPRSVAEVAALLSVPLGVARVLLSDMADLRLVRIHGTTMTAAGRPPMPLMRRVLEGLRRL